MQLLNCVRGHATTISTFRDFARKTENLICLTQEPWCDRHGNPPLLPNFNLFLPTPTKPRCATYVRQLPGLSATTTFTAQDSFLGTTITLQQEQHTTSFTIFNLYSPRRPEPLAALLPSLNIPGNCLIMGHLNAHHPWWQGPLPNTAHTSPASHAIVHWLCDTGTSGQRRSDGNIELVRFLNSHEGDGTRAVFAGVQLLYKNNFPNDPPSKFTHR